MSGVELLETQHGEIYNKKIFFADTSFPVFDSMVGQIGEIDNSAVRRLLILAYGRARSFIQSIRTNNEILATIEEAQRADQDRPSPITTGHLHDLHNNAAAYGDKLRESYSGVRGAVLELQLAIEAKLVRI